MNPFFTLCLFAISLLAITAACSLLLYVANELRLARGNGKHLNDDEKRQKAQEITAFLKRLRGATISNIPGEKKRIDSDLEKD